MAIYITLRKNLLNDSFTPQHITLTQKQIHLDRARNTVCNTGGNFYLAIINTVSDKFRSLIRYSTLSFVKATFSG